MQYSPRRLAIARKMNPQFRKLIESYLLFVYLLFTTLVVTLNIPLSVGCIVSRITGCVVAPIYRKDIRTYPMHVPYPYYSRVRSIAV